MLLKREEYGNFYSYIEINSECELYFACGYKNQFPIIFEDTDEKDNPDNVQIFAYKYINESLDKIIKSIKFYIYQNREILLEIYGEYDSKLKIGFPLLSSPEDLSGFFKFDEVRIKSSFKKNVALYCLIGKCSWDKEHDLGIVMSNENVVEFGDYDRATMFKVDDKEDSFNLFSYFKSKLNVPQVYNSNNISKLSAYEQNDYIILFDWLVSNRAVFGFRSTDCTLQNFEKINNILSIEKLNLSGKSFDIIPKQFSLLRNLKKIFLSHNNISKFPESIVHLESLEYLDLSFNLIEEIPEAICNLKNLKYLIMDYNNLKIIPNHIVNLTNLRWLHCSNNKVTHIPEFIYNHQSISDFRIENNPIIQQDESFNKSEFKFNFLNLKYLKKYILSIVKSKFL